MAVRAKALLLLAAVLCVANAMDLAFLVITSSQEGADLTYQHVKDVLAGPNVLYETLHCQANSNTWLPYDGPSCTSSFNNLVVLRKFAGIVVCGDLAYWTYHTDLLPAIHTYATAQGVRVVLPYTTPTSVFFNNLAGDGSWSNRNLVDKGRVVAHGLEFAENVLSTGQFFGTPCTNTDEPTDIMCVPGSVGTKTVRLTEAGKDMFCGAHAGSSGLSCDIAVASQGLFWYPVAHVPGAWQTGGDYVPVLAIDADDDLNYFDTASGTWANPAPRATIAQVWKVDLPGGVHVEQLEFYVAQGTWSRQSKTFGYVWLHYLSQNIYVGHRRVYLTPQIDDLFLSTQWRYELPDVAFPDASLYAPDVLAAKGAKKWPYRTSVQDLRDLAQWQRDFRAVLPRGSDFTIEMAFNGQGVPTRAWSAMPLPFLAAHGFPNPFNPANYIFDDLWWHLKKDVTPQGTLPLTEFFWVSHTWAHLSLTCDDFVDTIDESDATGPRYVSNRPLDGGSLFQQTTHAQAMEAFLKNKDLFNLLLQNTWSSMIRNVWGSPSALVPPKISGLYNAAALSAMLDPSVGITNVVGDNTRNGVNGVTGTLRTEYAPEKCADTATEPGLYHATDRLTPDNPYHGLYTTAAFNNYAGQYILPRWATEVYFDSSTLEENTYTYNNIVYKHAAGDELDAEQILHREADRVVTNLMGFKAEAHMFHQANLRFFFYDGPGGLLAPQLKAGRPWLAQQPAPFTCLTCIWSERVAAEYQKFFVFPMATLRQDDLAVLFHDRQTLDTYCNVHATAVTEEAQTDGLLMTAVTLKVSPKNAPPAGTECVVPFTGSTAATVDSTGVRAPRFLEAALDPDSLTPLRTPGNKPHYRTVFGPERSFYVRLDPASETNREITVRLAMPRFVRMPSNTASAFTVADEAGQAIPPAVLLDGATGAFRVVVTNPSATQDVALAVSTPALWPAVEGWAVTDGSGEAAGPTMRIAPLASHTFVISRALTASNRGRVATRFAVSSGARLWDVLVQDHRESAAAEMDITLDESRPDGGAVISGTTITIPAIPAFTPREFYFKLNAHGVEVTTPKLGTTLPAEKAVGVYVSSLATVPADGSGAFYITFYANPTGKFSTQLTVTSANGRYRAYTLVWEVTPPLRPLSVRAADLPAPLVDLGAVGNTAGDYRTATFTIDNSGPAAIPVQIGFGGQARDDEARRKRVASRTRRQDGVDSVDVSICESAEPVFTVTPATGVVPAQGSLVVTVRVAIVDPVNLVCGNTFMRSLSVYQQNSQQPNVIVDAVVLVEVPAVPTPTATPTPVLSATPSPAPTCATGQCGGQGWLGPTTCCAGYTCKVENEYFSQCVFASDCPAAECALLYGQCGGLGYTGPTTCPSASTCLYTNEYWSQCVPS
mmetsp:Transcript_34833/g.87617  ORF Transcript_34833/g.87617 Transcript_34833/m.87617 type:complete len:1388 (+) Transcript_34833:692-4855(+)|eukprot:CAMPEP_0177645502 /NCGR_PEP_ID=MMETSP0447-20121125/9284_1 /TAXON_ID=0 /ORGANISM="Stygamoeba regulata, Strain BSH-02190019" /LENGTH=1387 /DNA_ID=CAMNT_0019147991 /DNA_START=172 /DNA_END=4335 /DNA_ORIENTATION=-